jgi:hypothetical protein
MRCALRGAHTAAVQLLPHVEGPVSVSFEAPLTRVQWRSVYNCSNNFTVAYRVLHVCCTTELHVLL